MSSALQSTVEIILVDNYVSLAAVTVLVYDYVLIFTREIDYVWHRPWTWVSTIFVLVRYVGLTWAVLSVLIGTTFIPGPRTVYVSKLQFCTVTVLVQVWTYPIFIAAADVVMILRVYTMWNRSNTMVYTLLFICAAQISITIVFAAIYNNPNTRMSVTIAQVLNFYSCSYIITGPPLIDLGVQIPRFLLGTGLLVLAVAKTLKQSATMYKATRQWQPNRYLQLLGRDGVLYFLVNTLFNVVTLVTDNDTLNSIASICLYTFSSTAICIIMPRFIISVRELYDRDLRGRFQDIDSGFGVLSHPISNEVAVSAIEFADDTQNQGQIVEGEADGSEGIRLEEMQGGNAGPV